MRERESNVSRLRFFEQLLRFCFAAAAKKANYAAAYINHLAGCVYVCVSVRVYECMWEAQACLARVFWGRAGPHVALGSLKNYDKLQRAKSKKRQSRVREREKEKERKIEKRRKRSRKAGERQRKAEAGRGRQRKREETRKKQREADRA